MPAANPQACRTAAYRAPARPSLESLCLARLTGLPLAAADYFPPLALSGTGSTVAVSSVLSIRVAYHST